MYLLPIYCAIPHDEKLFFSIHISENYKGISENVFAILVLFKLNNLQIINFFLCQVHSYILLKKKSTASFS